MEGVRCISFGLAGVVSLYAKVPGGMPEFSVMVADQRHGAAQAVPSILSCAWRIGATEKALAGGCRALPPSRLDLFSHSHHVLPNCNDVKHELSRVSVADLARFREAAVAVES